MKLDEVRTLVIDILNRDHDVELSEVEMIEYRPQDVGLDSLSEAELMLEISEALDLIELTSPVSNSNFEVIAKHFHGMVKDQNAK